MSCGTFRYLFGPIASRRFGRSLGVDLLGRRICSFDCVFCEAGPTQTCTFVRDAFTPVALVISELRAWFGAGGEADVVTLAGRGEPTLHTGFGAVIDAIHGMSALPVVLLSNGSLLWMPEVRAAAARADIVKISLSGWDDASLAAVNQPAAGVTFDAYLAGMIAFRKQFRGELRLEVMFLAGFNDTREAAGKIARLAALLAPDKVELNTVVRPPADSRVLPVADDKLAAFVPLFGSRAVVIGRCVAARAPAVPVAAEQDPGPQILALLARRGCTLAEIALAVDLSQAVTAGYLQRMVAAGVVVRTGADPGYYQVGAGVREQM
ncbi:MAG: radical SAM protein [Kiritimatiellia bacterium]